MLRRSLTRFSVGLFVLALFLSASAASGQLPQPDTSKLLSSTDVSDEQVQKAARIAVSVRMATRKDRMRMRKEMKKKYGNPQQMDSTQKARARKEMRRRQMKMRKKQMKLMQQHAKKEGMTPQTFRTLMRSAQKDTTLRKRIQKAMKMQMKRKSSPQNQ